MIPPSLIDAVLAIAEGAGELTLAYHPRHAQASGVSLRPMQVQRKSDASPVTKADLAANQHIVAGLAVLTPDIPLVSEELPESEQFRCAQGRFWLIDPLDGTREFIAGGDEYTVNIALIEQGVAVWGVVYAPASRQLFWGGTSVGSFKRVAGKTTQLQVQTQICPSNHQPIRVVASKSHMNTATRMFIERLGSHVELVQAGSSLKLCLIAQTDADLYPRLGDTAEWDTAAAQAVLEGAGGVVSDLQGRRLCYGKPDVLNPYFLAASAPLTHWFKQQDLIDIQSIDQ